MTAKLHFTKDGAHGDKTLFPPSATGKISSGNNAPHSMPYKRPLQLRKKRGTVCVSRSTPPWPHHAAQTTCLPSDSSSSERLDVSLRSTWPAAVSNRYAATSLRPDLVLFSPSSKTIVLLELTVPLEDKVHLAHDRKISKYCALVMACEENGFKTHMFALEVGCLGYLPHPFLYCFIALSLPKSPAHQIRPEVSKTPFALRMSSFFTEA